ncbi:eCIS core domain-containing protein [Nostoc sp.]
MQEPKQDKNATTKTDRQQTAVKSVSRNGQGIAASPLDPLVQQVSRMGNAPNPSAHAAILNRAPANQQSSNRQLLLQLQQQYGNPYVNQVLQLARGMGGQTAANTTEKPLMQAKLTIGSVGDKYEQEADRTAQLVVQRMNAPSQPDRSQVIGREAMPEAELQKKPEISTIQRQEMPKEKEEEQQAEVKQETDSLQLQKKCGGCEKKEEDNLAQMKPETGTFPQEELPKDEEKEELTMQLLAEHQPAEGGMAATPKLETSIQQKRGKGQPLSDKLREPMEQAFGKDFSGVRVHADAQSDQINRSIQARAFTTGQDIFFRQGEYASGSKQGQELLAHELTHVVQQNGSAIKAKTEEGVTLSELSPDARVQRLCSNCEKEEKPENTLQAKEVSSGTLAVAPEPEVSISQVTQPAIQRVFDDLPDRREPKAPKQEKEKQPEAPEETAESDTSDCDQQGDANKPQPEAQQEEQQPEKCPSEKEDKGKKQPKPEKTKPLKDKLSEKPASCVRQEQNPILQAFAPIPTATPNLTARSAITTATNTSTPQQNLQATGETASPETAAEKVQATTTATEAQGQLRTTDAEVARLASSKINFKLPKQEETDTDNNSAALEEQRAAASSMASNFFAEAALRIQTVTGLGQSISARINGVAENAKASVMSTVQQQQDAVAAQINQQRTQVNSQAQRSIAEIQQQYQATLRNISLRTAEVSQRIQTEYSNAFQKVDQGETNLLSRVDQLYIQTYDQYIAAGDTVGNEATAVGEKWVKQWESEITDKYSNEDAVVEDRGHMRSTRPNAGKTVEVAKNSKIGKKASTATEVAKQYKEQVTEEATKQANNLVKGKAKDIKGICCAIKEFRKQLQKQQEETLKAVIDLQQDAVLQVTEAQTQLTESANQTLQATLQSLDEQETAQLQILQGYGDRQVLAIERDAQKAIASLQKGVNQAAKKLLTALQDYYSEFQGMEAPNPDELSVTLAEILGQFDNSIATVQKETEKGIAVSEDGIAQGEQQAVSAVGAIAQTVMEESAAVIEEAKTSFTNLDRGITNTFNQLRDAYTQAANKFVEATAKGLAQITQNSQNPLEQIYQKLSEALQKSVTQIETGLRDTLKCLETDIQNYAAKAVEDEPWWKSLLKALVFIVVIVVAIVLAPIGIGFVAGALGGGIAATIFASVVVGAALGAGLGALSQIANNAIDGKNLMDGVGKAALAGAIGGAVGGFGGVLGGVLGNVGKLGAGLSKTLSKFGIETVFDTLGNIVGDLAAGNPITLEGVLMGAAIGAGTYVATTKGTLRRLGKPGEKIQSFQERSSEAGMRGGAFVGGKVKSAFDGTDTSVGSRSGVDGKSAKPSETEVKTSETIVPGGQGVDIPTVSRPDVDVTGVKPPETEVKAPDMKKISETSTPSQRSTHYDEPEIDPVNEPGVVAKEKTADGHEIKVLKDGRVIRCSSCQELKDYFNKIFISEDNKTQINNKLDEKNNSNDKNNFAKQILNTIKELDNTLSINDINLIIKSYEIENIIELNNLQMSGRQIKTYSEVINKSEIESILKYSKSNLNLLIFEEIIRIKANDIISLFKNKNTPKTNKMPLSYDNLTEENEKNKYKELFYKYKNVEELLQSNLSNEEVQSNLSNKEVQSNLSNEEVQPNLSNEEVQPNLSNEEVQPNLSNEEVQPNLSNEEVQPNLLDEEIQQLGVLALKHTYGKNLQAGWISQVFKPESRQHFEGSYAPQMQQSRGFGGAKGRAVKQEGILGESNLPSTINKTEQENGYKVVILNNGDKFTEMNIPGKNYYKKGTPKQLGLQQLPDIKDKTNKSWKKPLDRVHVKGKRKGKWKFEGGKTSGLPIFNIPAQRGWSKEQKIHKDKLFEVLKEQDRDPNSPWSPITAGKIAEESNIKWFIEISHMMGAGTGGSTRITNAWPASVHQNTEQLAIEEVIRKSDFSDKLLVRFTNYINPKTGQAEFMRIKIANKNTERTIFDHIMDATRGNIDETEVRLLQETLNEKIKASIQSSSDSNTASGSGDAIILPTESEMKSSNSENDIMFTDVRTKEGTKGLEYLEEKYLLKNKETSEEEKETSENDSRSITVVTDSLSKLSLKRGD